MRKLVTRTAVVTTAAVALSGVSIAYAAWSASGSATGSSGGAAVAKQPLGVTVTAPSGIYPTQLNAGTISATVDNDNPYNVTVTGMTVTGATCGTGDTAVSVPTGVFTYGAASVTTALAERKLGGTNGTEGTDATVTRAITAVSSDLPDACAGQAISFAVSVIGDQSAATPHSSQG